MPITKRIGKKPSGGQTSRIPQPLFLLEGDESGFLLLEGDAQSGDDKIKLDGDESLTISSNATKRVTGTPGGGQTARVSGAPGGGATQRIQPFLLLLSGDQQDNGDGLLLAGDVQTGNDALKLAGDQARIAANVTKRVAL